MDGLDFWIIYVLCLIKVTFPHTPMLSKTSKCDENHGKWGSVLSNLLSAPINLLCNDFFTASERDEVEKLVSFWSSRRGFVTNRGRDWSVATPFS